LYFDFSFFCSFIVHDRKRLERELLPLYVVRSDEDADKTMSWYQSEFLTSLFVLLSWFRQKQYGSFLRQLNNYDFRKLHRSAAAGEMKAVYAHRLFLKDRPELSERIDRVAHTDSKPRAAGAGAPGEPRPQEVTASSSGSATRLEGGTVARSIGGSALSGAAAALDPIVDLSFYESMGGASALSSLMTLNRNNAAAIAVAQQQQQEAGSPRNALIRRQMADALASAQQNQQYPGLFSSLAFPQASAVAQIGFSAMDPHPSPALAQLLLQQSSRSSSHSDERDYQLLAAHQRLLADRQQLLEGQSSNLLTAAASRGPDAVGNYTDEVNNLLAVQRMLVREQQLRGGDGGAGVLPIFQPQPQQQHFAAQQQQRQADDDDSDAAAVRRALILRALLGLPPEGPPGY